MPECRRYAVLSTGRQDWGLLRPLCARIQRHDGWELYLMAGGMALDGDHGDAVRSMEEQGFEPARRIRWDVSDAAPEEQAADALRGVGAALARCDPDGLIVLGDRLETAAAAMAATIARVPLVHLCGGEETEGAFDNAFRHAITKMAHLHLVSHDAYARRVLQMGEVPGAVHVVGHPAVDNIADVLDDIDDAPGDDLGISWTPPVGLVTLHPTTLSDGAITEEVEAVIGAMERVEATYVVTLPNADPGGNAIRRAWESLAARNDRVYCFPSLGERRYLEAMYRCDFVLGNSSSGMTEAPILRRPTINVGPRQAGRLRFPSVIDVPPVTSAIVGAMETAMEDAFLAICRTMPAPYGGPGVADRIIEVLERWFPDRPPVKRFQPLEW